MTDDKWLSFKNMTDQLFNQRQLHYLLNFRPSKKSMNIIWNNIKDIILTSADLFIDHKFVDSKKAKPKHLIEEIKDIHKLNSIIYCFRNNQIAHDIWSTGDTWIDMVSTLQDIESRN